MSTNYTDLLYKEEKGIATITINRPKVLNAFSAHTVEELIQAFLKAGWNKKVGVIVLTGTGDRAFERRIRSLAQSRPNHVAATIGFDEAYAHLIEGGADLFLMPSRFEPCGMNQMYSQRYGTPPVARATGGLADTILDATPAALADGTATGFLFAEESPVALLAAIERALDVYREPKAWRQIQRAGMAADFSWGAAARRYVEVYAGLLRASGG